MTLKRVVLSLMAAVAAAQAWPLRYRCMDLGYLYHGEAVAYGVNGSQTVVGETPSGFSDFLWTPNGGMRLLGPRPALRLNGSCLGINDAGWVVGWTGWIVGGKYREFLPFLWQPSKGYLLLDRMGASQGFAFGVNSLGQSCGYVHDPENAVLWDADGKGTKLGRLDPAYGSTATGVNDSGVVCGYAGVPPPTGFSHAFRWTHATGMVDLGLLPGANVMFARAVNNHGTIVGYGENFTTGFLSGFRLRGGGPLEALGPYWFLAVNDREEIVGYMSTPTSHQSAMVYDSLLGAVDLNAVTAGIPQGWTLYSATGINSQGDICCNAAVGNRVRAVLLVRTD